MSQAMDAQGIVASGQGRGPDWDLIIVGGGITGAGVFREAVRTGARVLLLEARDFGSGTSSASSKLVHGGLRYLKNGQWRLTRESVRERERLLTEAAGLVEPLGFAMPVFEGQRPGPLALRAGLRIYDWMAGRRRSRWLPRGTEHDLVPGLGEQGRRGVLYYEDARTDDARLTLRLILQGVAEGGEARHYAPVRAPLRDASGRVSGVVLADGGVETARMVVNAAGPWAAGEWMTGGAGLPRLRPLRGSHLVFPRRRLPLTLAVSWMHASDRRPVFACPWEGAVVLGTTDLDHAGAVDDPCMSRDEAEYLLAGLRQVFPDAGLGVGDAVACYAGVRPVVAGGAASPSAESRESVLWSEAGLVGITGGKLTTFRVTARQVLAEAARQHPTLTPRAEARVFADQGRERLDGRYGDTGAAAIRVASAGDPSLRARLGDTPYTLAEIVWSAGHERVRHLDDLLLRRVRLGLVAPDGGDALLALLEAPCRDALGWSDTRWREEVERYRALWGRLHRPPQP